MMFKKGVLVLLSMVLVSVVGLSSCGSKKKQDGNKEITILYPNWAEGIAITYVTKAFLEGKGYSVTAKQVDPGVIYASLSRGDADFMMDGWLPFTHSKYWEKYGKKLAKLGTTSKEGGSTGLVVPSYVKENSIADLKGAKDKYDGKIIGIGAGAGIHANTIKAIKEYNLGFTQITSSETAMLAELKRAYKKKKPVVITGWKPHQKWVDYDLKYLKDPKKVYPVDVMTIVGRKGFAKDFPQVAAFLKNFNLPKDKLYDLLAKHSKNTAHPEKTGKEWYQANKAMVDGFWK